MNEKVNIAILDSDKNYINSFNDYMKERKSSHYDIEFFTESELLDLYCKENRFDMIVIAECIISEYAMKKESKEGDIDKEDLYLYSLYQENKEHIAVLVEDDDISSIDGISVIYRYQAADMIIKNILDLCAEREFIIDNNSGHLKKKLKGVVSIYSPINRCGKTMFSIHLGLEMVRRNFKVLLINFEEFSLMMEYMNIDRNVRGNGDLSDLLYFYISGNSAFSIKAETIIGNYDGLDFIPPTECIGDLRNTDTAVIMEFIKKIGSIKGYDLVLIDLSCIIGDIFGFMSMSDKTIVPIIDEGTSILKIQKFRNYIDSGRFEIAKDNIIDINMKNVKNSYKGEEFKKVADEIEKTIRGG